MNLRVIKAGVMDTVQDLGRYGFQHLGINPGGAMDKMAAQLANILAGNSLDEAVIEMHFPAAAYFFEKPALISLTGADFAASINGEPVPCLRPILVSKFSILQFHRVHQGARAYLAVHGGFELQQWLNSYSTHLRAGAGGYKGRALQKDDELVLRNPVDFTEQIGKKEFDILPWKTDTNWGDIQSKEILVLPGHEWALLSDHAKEIFFDRAFLITNQSDRMGYRLKSEPLTTSSHEERVTSAVDFGTVQLLPNGQLTILMADHQTTGGYPRVAHVISVHHSRLAQKKPGDLFIFRFADQQLAEELLIKQSQHLRQLQNACRFRLEEWLANT
jgi:antagonist of KipI